ncbi:MAG: hypothetical protein ABUS54_00185 [Actinomycetota bacterium]
MGRRLVVLVVAVLALAACGGGAGSKSNGEAGKSAARVIADAQAAAAGATIAHVTGAGRDNNQPLRLDLWIGKAKAKGTLVENGLSFQLIRIGDVIYIKGSDAFLKKFAGATAVTLFHGRWLKSSATSGELAALAPLTDLQTFFKGILGQHGKVVNKGETTFKGQKAVEIRDTTQSGSLFVAATGPAYPLGLAGKAQHGNVTFADWDADVAIAAPKNAVDLSKLP